MKMNLKNAATGAMVAAMITAAGCQTSHLSRQDSKTQAAPVSAFPDVVRGVLKDPHPLPAEREIADLTAPGAVAHGTAEATIIDTRVFNPQIAPAPVGQGRPMGVKVHLPPHTTPRVNDNNVGGLQDFPVGTTREDFLVDQGSITQFSGIHQTAWVPPDPSIAVGPNHVVSTVNMTVAWFTKDGTQQFEQILGSQGSPGFFEPTGAGDFTFDPKCFYDHYANRFVVLALEVYSNSAYITIAVSDDDDPNGIWYKYRTDAVINVSGDTFWWDYPGLGYDQDAYYVCGNLFGLNNGGFAGVGFRVFDKSDMLNGSPVNFSTLRDPGGASAQAVQHFGNNGAAFFASEGGGSSIKIYGITNPLTSPALNSTFVSVPSYSTTGSAPVQGGGSLFIVDGRIMNANWRDGKLLVTHHIASGGVSQPRWYEFNTGNWPNSGGVSLTQSGNVNPGSGVYGFFPAIYSNNAGDIGMVFGTSSFSQPTGVSVTARKASDPAGTMAAPVQIRLSPVAGSDGRWGDYFDIALDPTDGTTFWVVGETQESFGWDTRIASFRLETPPCPADLTGDGVLDLDDINAFVQAFQNGDLLADLTGDGVLDLQDINEFVQAFTAGCP